MAAFSLWGVCPTQVTPMIRTHLGLVPLEDRATASATLPDTPGTSCPPQDPMDNPPPAQPVHGDGSDESKGNGQGKGPGFIVTPPAVANVPAPALLPVTRALLGRVG